MVPPFRLGPASTPKIGDKVNPNREEIDPNFTYSFVG